MSPHLMGVSKRVDHVLPVLHLFRARTGHRQDCCLSRRGTARRLAWLVGRLAAIVAWPALAASGAAGGTAAPHTEIASLPAALQGVISARFGADDPAFRIAAEGAQYRTDNSRHGFTATMGTGGLAVRAAGGEWRLRLTAWGRGESRQTTTVGGVTASANRVEIARGRLTEWWVNGPLGLDQGWTVAAPPREGGDGPLTLVLVQGGSLKAGAGANDRTLMIADAAGRPLLRYAGLAAVDATGRELPASFDVAGREVHVRIEDAGAVYPVRIDPWLQAAELTASDGAASDFFGSSVAVSGDGSTVVAGAGNHQVGSNLFAGAAYVFVRPASGWANATQVAELTASDGAQGDSLGGSVAVSSDGSTVVAGARDHQVGSNAGQGAAYVFVRPQLGWANGTQMAELTASDGAQNDNLGLSVAVSGDSSTVVAGVSGRQVGSNASQGVAYVFVRPRLGWADATQVAELTASDGAQGDSLGGSVTVSSDGSTIVAGAAGHRVVRGGTTVGIGAAYVFGRPASGWANATQTAELSPSSCGSCSFTYAVAVSGDGSTVVGGAPDYQAGLGVAFVFVEPAGGWVDATQTATLSASDGAADDSLGHGVAVNADGSTVVAGAYQHQVGSNPGQGAAYVFVRPASGWADETETAELTASDGVAYDRLGLNAGVSSDGSNIVAGVRFRQVGSNQYQGVAYVFAPPGGVRGTVTDSAYNQPVVGARVQAGTAWTITDSNGNYLLGLDAGTYSVTASKPGFLPSTVNGVTVSAGQWTVQDFSLSSAGTAWVDGYVTDAGHGWPLLASVAITTGGTSIATVYTNPFNGYYLINLATGYTYTFTVNAVQPGYVQQMIVVDVPGADQTQNFALFPDSSCTVPGYTLGAGCTPVAGGLVAGFVTDANTNDPLVGAKVANDLGASTLTVTPPSGSGLAAGYYSMFTPIPPFNQPAIRTFTASYSSYGNVQQQLVINPGWIVQADFTLQAGWLEISPTSLFDFLTPGQTDDQSLMLTNHGGLDANFQLFLVPQQLYVPSLPRDPAGPIVTTPPGKQQLYRSLKGIPWNGPVHAPAPLAVTPITTWPTALGNPWGLGVQQNAGNVWVSSLGPDIGGIGDSKDHAFTSTGTATGNTIDFSSFYYQYAADMAFDTLNNTMWQMNVNIGDPQEIDEFDPNTATWTGNKIQVHGLSSWRTGLAYDWLSDTFFIGGWNDGMVYRFNRTGTIVQSKNVGLPIAGLAFNAGTGHLLVQENSSTDTVTVLDVNNNYAFVTSFTVAGFGNYAGAGIEIDCQGHLWAMNQVDGKVYEIDSGEAASCPFCCAPWLTVTPTSGTVTAHNESNPLPIDAQFIADGAPRFGQYEAQIMTTSDTPYPTTPVSVCFTKAYTDVPLGSFAEKFIHAVSGAQITQGCGGSLFCPSDVMTRGTMARWMEIARHGAGYTVPRCVGIFADVPCETTPNADYIEAFYNEGITAGCGTNPLIYCPNDPVTRAQMAVLIMKSWQGPSYVPPACTGIFADVSCPNDFAVNWIEDLYNHSITAGCGTNPLIFCPNTDTTRAQEAVFVEKAWNIPMCP